MPLIHQEKRHVLNDLLGNVSQFHPHYGDRLAMHLPMTLIALYQLGANEDKLTTTYQNSIGNLSLIEPLEQPASHFEINEALGDSASYERYLAYFRQQLATQSVEFVLTHTLPVLIPGMAASAFHAMIRLAYALEANHTDEIAIALAYWSAEYQAFDLNQQRTSLSLTEILSSVVNKGESYNFSPGIIVDRMNEIGALLKNEQTVIQPNNLSLDDVRQFALTAFYAEDDFTLLHTVTGCHALSQLLPYITNKEQAIRELWQAIVVAYLSTGLPFAPQQIPLAEDKTRDFEQLKPLALRSDDSHEIKLFYTCYQAYVTYNEPGYYWLAKRALTHKGSD
ncbi:questin oxidase family protein [Thalassotalea fusca]